MAQAQASDLFPCTPEQFFKIISDYSHYHEFLSEIKKCEVLKVEEGRKLVQYTVSVMKEFRYQLWMKEDPPLNITWEFASGDLFKSMKGSWKLTEEAGKTRAEYRIEAEFGLFVPGPIAKALVSVNLPNMMSAYQKRVREVYGRA